MTVFPLGAIAGRTATVNTAQQNHRIDLAHLFTAEKET